MDNTGLVEVLSGTLSVTSAGSTNAGMISISAGAVLQHNGTNESTIAVSPGAELRHGGAQPFVYAGGSQVIGDGVSRAAGGMVTVDGTFGVTGGRGYFVSIAAAPPADADAANSRSGSDSQAISFFWIDRSGSSFVLERSADLQAWAPVPALVVEILPNASKATALHESDDGPSFYRFRRLDPAP